jgi:four helix bundle protein
MQDFRKLKVWSKAHRLTLAAYTATQTFPRNEQYGLTAQVRRAASSVCANIAEGCGGRGRIDFARYLQIAFGSASELEYHLILAADLKYLEPERYRSLCDAVIEVKRMLASLIRRLKDPTDD